MKSHHIKLALVATIRTRPNLNISADEIPSVFIPLSNELLEMIHKVLTLLFSGAPTGRPVEAAGRNVLQLLVMTRTGYAQAK